MELELAENGNPKSPFLIACAGRRIDLNGKGPHPIQLIPSLWRSTSSTLVIFVNELAEIESQFAPDGTALMLNLRRLVYDATELFDGYTNLLAGCIKPANKDEKAALSNYKDTAKRLRSDCAQLCNLCKHNGAKLNFLWARSTTNGLTGSRFMVTSYQNGDSLLRDDTIHKGSMAGIGIVRWTQTLAHNLLRIDRAAGELIKKLADRDCEPNQAIPPELPVGSAVRQLIEIRASRHQDEDRLHDGIVLSWPQLILKRVSSEDFGPHADITATLNIEAGTRHYSVA